MKKEKEVQQDEIKQLDLGIKEPLKNKFFKIKGEIDLAILQFEVRKFLKDPLVWASIIISIVLITQQIYLISNNYTSLPVYIPVYRYFISIPRKLVEREYIIIFPIISIIASILSLIFTSRYYNSERLLTKFLLFGLILCNISQTVILIDLVKFF
jgi:hypothetical protein